MKERPILFSGPMVNAILEGRKTQTRRVIDTKGIPADEFAADLWLAKGKCRYGTAGDKLWVRETWGVGTRPHPIDGCVDGIEYRADEAYLDEYDDLPLYEPELPDDVCLGDYESRWRPSIHMPRWASRITLEVTDVRVERLQEISDWDARREGISYQCPSCGYTHDDAAEQMDHRLCSVQMPPAASLFRELWDSINAKKHPWESNPWVWVVEFKQEKAGA